VTDEGRAKSLALIYRKRQSPEDVNGAVAPVFTHNKKRQVALPLFVV
jgi:hypothetical protein